MSANTDIDRLYHMIAAAKEAMAFAENRSRKDLDNDRALIHCLVRCLEIVGEAASKISSDLRQNNSEIPWEYIVGMRNRLIHAYFDINLDIVWKTIKEELPELVAKLEKIS